MVKIKDMLLTPNNYSRPQNKISVKGIVWHWVANPNTSAEANRNFFDNRKYGKTGYGSAHYIIGLDGEIVRCLPDNEMGYHVGSKTYSEDALKELSSYPNGTTIGIECTHTDWDGTMTDETRKSLIELTAELCKKYDLGADDIWLHQEVVLWKDCHRWYVNNPVEFKNDKDAVAKLISKPASTPKKPASIKDTVLVEADAKGLYEIKKGDTLWGISQALDVSVAELEKLNPDVKAKSLSVGQKIRVKEVAIKEHTISKGDTLWGIANKYNTTVAKLEELNKGVKAKALQVGAKIAVADGGKSAPAPTPAPVKPKAPAPKPAHKHNFKKLGRAKGNVWSHSKADITVGTRKVVQKSGTRLEVCCEFNGMYYTDEGWISKKYVEIVGDLNRIDLPSVTLRRGDRGGNVAQVQRALNKLYFKCGAEDGIFDLKTQDALKRFQSVHDAYKVNGVYSSRVEKKMEALLNK